MEGPGGRAVCRYEGRLPQSTRAAAVSPPAQGPTTDAAQLSGMKMAQGDDAGSRGGVVEGWHLGRSGRNIGRRAA